MHMGLPSSRSGLVCNYLYSLLILADGAPGAAFVRGMSPLPAGTAPEVRVPACGSLVGPAARQRDLLTDQTSLRGARHILLRKVGPSAVGAAGMAAV